MDRKQLAIEISAKVSIVDVVGQYVQLTKAGRNYKGLCPFHNEATPSFLVSADKGIYKCFGCGEGGDAISFVSKMEGISYGEATTRLAEVAGVDAQTLRRLKQTSQSHSFEKEYNVLKFAAGFYQYYLFNTDEGRVALEYLASRDITAEIITQFGIGLAPRDGNLIIKALESNGYSFEVAKQAGLLQQSENGDYYSPFKSRIMFTVVNAHNNVVGFSGRTYLDDGESYAKYINSPESRVFQKSQIIYNLQEAKKASRVNGRFLMFEGFLDVIASYKAGFLESVATMGTALTAEHVKALSKHAKEVVLCFDGDKAGLEATAKAIPILFAHQLQVKVIRIPGGLDPDDFVRQNGIDKFSEVVADAVGALTFMYEYAKQGLDLTTPDGGAEFERRLTHIGQQYGVGADLVWKFRKEEKKQQSSGFKKQNEAGRMLSSRGQISQGIGQPLPTTPREVKAEKELIYYMLLDKQVFDLVNARIGTTFNVNVHRKIVQGIEAYYSEKSTMNQEEFFARLDVQVARMARDIVYELKGRPKEWTKKMIKELCDRVEIGAMKLEWDGKKQTFLGASCEKQRSMIGEVTSSLVD